MTTRPFSITATEAEKGKRLDKMLALHISGFSRNVLQKAIEAGQIFVNGKRTDKDYALKIGDVVSGALEQPEEPSVEPDSSVPFTVVHDAPGFAVIDKPAGVVVHPSYTHKKGTLVNGLVARWPEMLGVGEHSFRPGIVHRLDKETSGLMVVAKTNEMFVWLKKQFKEHEVVKKYVALVFGKMKDSEGEIIAPIVREGMKQIVPSRMNKGFSGKDDKSRKATTGFKILGFYDDFTLVEATPKTGRMHQIRVHFKHIGHPLAGDKKYAPARLLRSFPLDRQFLHAASLAFSLPDGTPVFFTSSLPQELENVLAGLKNRG